MAKLLICLLVLSLTSLAVSKVILTTCARMDTPILEKAARAACFGSCNVQNCGTGYCEKRSGRPVCVCSRCANGQGKLPDIPVKKGK